jgi:hypothetical protein
MGRIEKLKKRKFYAQRAWARARGIKFLFTYEEWEAWWEKQLGPRWWLKRGLRAHQFVMARKGDKGPYHPSNVACITASQHAIETNSRREYLPETGRKIAATKVGDLNPQFGKPGTMLGRKQSKKAKKQISESLALAYEEGRRGPPKYWWGKRV